MSPHLPRARFEFPPRERGVGRTAGGKSLEERLLETCRDRVASAAELIAESSERAWEWARDRPFDWDHATAAAELERGLADWSAAHGWRAPAALWLDALRRTLDWAKQCELATPREALLEELAQWIPADDPEPGEAAWTGEPLGEGRRLPLRRGILPWLLRDLERGESLLVHGFSETVALALEAAQEAGLAPQVSLTEGGPELGGKRMARRLAAAGVAVRLGYDLAWLGRMAEFDRIWVGSEAIGAGAFLGRVGTCICFEAGRRQGVACELLATSDKLSPGGRLELPAWGAEEDWILWSDAPAGVALERQPFERVPLGLVDAFWTEAGRETARGLFLRALPPEPLPAGEGLPSQAC